MHFTSSGFLVCPHCGGRNDDLGIPLVAIWLSHSLSEYRDVREVFMPEGIKVFFRLFIIWNSNYNLIKNLITWICSWYVVGNNIGLLILAGSFIPYKKMFYKLMPSRNTFYVPFQYSLICGNSSMAGIQHILGFGWYFAKHGTLRWRGRIFFFYY